MTDHDGAGSHMPRGAVGRLNRPNRGRKDIVRPLSALELKDMRTREDREGHPYSDRDMLLDHVEFLQSALNAALSNEFEWWKKAEAVLAMDSLSRDPRRFPVDPNQCQDGC